MKSHRSTRSNVAKNAKPDNREPTRREPDNRTPDNREPTRREPFDPAAALESLHTEVVQLETFAHLAGEVVTRLSPPANRAQRRDYIRLYALVTKVATDAIAAVHHGDALISALSAHLAVRRTAHPDAVHADS
jgi:hypothetical protein